VLRSNALKVRFGALALALAPILSHAAPAGNPIVDGWYADPDMKVYNGVYWVYPTYSAPYDQQTFLDAFSSTDLINWTKHPKVLDKSSFSWATRAIWAPSPISRNGNYYLYFGANDIQNNSSLGGIGVGIAHAPEGPYADAIGRPLIGQFQNGAQPIDQNVFIDDNGQAYLYYGGWGHCNVVKLNSDMISLGTHADGTVYKEITPSGYVEGVLMFKRQGKYYLMWSEGGWTGPDYRVSYATGSSAIGPFTKGGTILSQSASIGTGAGHNTVVNVPGTDTWYIFYHRHPLGETDGNHRVLCYDKMIFNADGSIQPVVMACEDNFGDGNDLGWTKYGGTWKVAGGQFAVAPSAGAKALLNNNFSTLTYDADVSVGAAGDAGLLFRVTNPSAGADAYSGYYVGLNAASDTVVLGKANGGWTQLATSSQTINPGTLYHLQITANGSNIAVYFNHSTIPCISITDSSFASGATGLRTFNGDAKFDNLTVTPSVNQGGTGGTTAATLYQDCSYGGYAVALAEGAYTTTQLLNLGVKDNDVSSLKLTGGYTATLYDGDNFAGTAITKTADTECLANGTDNFNDLMSSLKIAKTEAAGVVFYADVNTSGAASQALAKGSYTLSQLQALGFLNDWASSCKIPSGWTVVMYADNNFTGTSWTLTSSSAGATNFTKLSPSANDLVSSIKIQ